LAKENKQAPQDLNLKYHTLKNLNPFVQVYLDEESYGEYFQSPHLRLEVT